MRHDVCPHCGHSQIAGQILSTVDSEGHVRARGWSVDGPIFYYDATGQPLTAGGQPCHDHTGTPLYGRHTIGVTVAGVYDGVLFWECPFCQGRWHRFKPGDRLYERAVQLIGPRAAR